MSGSGAGGPSRTGRPSRSERLYRRLLALYPAAFRELYGTDMVELFRDRLGEAKKRRGVVGVALLWTRTLPNVVVNGLLERWADLGRDGPGVGMAAAARRLMRAPGLTATVVLTLGVGIGANVALFSVLRGVLLAPLPYPDADRLVHLWETNPTVEQARQGPSPLNSVDWERMADETIESMTSWYLTSGTFRVDDVAEEVRSAQVSAAFFDVVGVEPLLGRAFRREEVVEYGPLVISHPLWLRLFGGDPDVVGRSVVVSGASYEVVGVMPPGFAFPDESVESWLAWDIATVYSDRPETRGWRFMSGLARLHPDASPEDAERELDAIAAGLAEAYPDINAGWDAAVTTLHEETVGEVRATLWLAFGAVLFILLIACANVANLLLARVPARSRELAIRATLGASRGRIARELVGESVLLATAAGVVGVLVGAGLLDALVALDAGSIPPLDEVGIDAGVLGFTVLITTATAVVFGLAPAWQALRGSARSALGDGLRTTSGHGHRRMRDVFVGAQVAVALVLLAGAGLFTRSLRAVTSVDPGIDVENVATFRVSLDPVAGDPSATVRYYDELRERISALPGVRAVGSAQTLPLSPVAGDFRRPYRHVGSALQIGEAPTVQMRIVTPGYMEAIGMTLLDGTPPPSEAYLGEPLVAVVNETLARRLWPGESAVGRTFEIEFRDGWQPYRVTGVTRDVRHEGPRTPPLPEVFLSHRQIPYLAQSFVVRTDGDPEALTDALRETVLTHVPMQPPYNFVPLASLYDAATAEDRFLSVLLAVFASIGVLLAMTGVYGVLSYTVAHRRAEIGVRMALGAEPDAVVRSVLRDALTVTAAGIGVGAVGVAALTRVVEGRLFEVEPTDPLTHLSVLTAVVVVSVVAAWLPARRAARVAPSEALRPE